MTIERHTRSIPELFTDVVSQVTTLVRKETQLARAEMSENVSRAAYGLGFIVGGAVLLIPALVILLQAGVATLIEQYGLAAPWAAVIVGGVALLIGAILLFVGLSRLKIENMMPRRTLHQLQSDASVAKDQMRERHDIRRAA